MKKSRFDTRPWEEIVGNLISERTSAGDLIQLEITYNGQKKPTFSLRFSSYDPEKSGLPSLENISDWIPETPYYYVIDDTTGKPAPGEEAHRGYADWKSYIHEGFGPDIQRIIGAGGRQFSFKEN